MCTTNLPGTLSIRLQVRSACTTQKSLNTQMLCRNLYNLPSLLQWVHKRRRFFWSLYPYWLSLAQDPNRGSARRTYLGTQKLLYLPVPKWTPQCTTTTTPKLPTRPAHMEPPKKGFWHTRGLQGLYQGALQTHTRQWSSSPASPVPRPKVLLRFWHPAGPSRTLGAVRDQDAGTPPTTQT